MVSLSVTKAALLFVLNSFQSFLFLNSPCLLVIFSALFPLYFPHNLT